MTLHKNIFVKEGIAYFRGEFGVDIIISVTTLFKMSM